MTKHKKLGSIKNNPTQTQKPSSHLRCGMQIKKMNDYIRWLGISKVFGCNPFSVKNEMKTTPNLLFFLHEILDTFS